MTRAERIRLWSVLSEVFVDNPVDYGFIARQVAGFDRITVQATFARSAGRCRQRQPR